MGRLLGTLLIFLLAAVAGAIVGYLDLPLAPGTG